MKDHCQFLKPESPVRILRCTAGINFAIVGPNRERCRVCPLADLGDLPLCPNADVYAYLTGNISMARVEIEFACLADVATRAATHCALCPARIQKSCPAPDT